MLRSIRSIVLSPCLNSAGERSAASIKECGFLSCETEPDGQFFRQEQLFAIERWAIRLVADTARDRILDELPLVRVSPSAAFQFGEIPRRRQHSAAFIGALKRTIKPLARRVDQQGKDKLLFVKGGEFLADFVAKITFEHLTIAVAQKCVFANGPGKNTFVHSEDKQRAKAQTTRCRGIQHSHPPHILIGCDKSAALEPVLKSLAELVQQNVRLNGVETSDLIEGTPNLVTHKGVSIVRIDGQFGHDS